MRGLVKQKFPGSCTWMHAFPHSLPPPPGEKTCPWEPFLGVIPLGRAGTGQRHHPPHPQLSCSSSMLCCFLLTWALQNGQFDSLAGRGHVSQTFPSVSASSQLL